MYGLSAAAIGRRNQVVRGARGASPVPAAQVNRAACRGYRAEERPPPAESDAHADSGRCLERRNRRDGPRAASLTPARSTRSTPTSSKPCAPILIVTQALCDVCAVAEAEVQAAVCPPGRPPVVNLEPQTLTQVFEAIGKVAGAAVVLDRADHVVARLRARVEAVAGRRRARRRHAARVALLEWLDPPFSCGHWNPELVRLVGGIEVLGREGHASRTLTWAEVRASEPDVILVACCGFGVERTLEDLRRLQDAPVDVIAGRARRPSVVTDGSHYFSRPGPRLVDSLEILAHDINPTRYPLADGLEAARPVEVSAFAPSRFGGQAR